MASAGWAYYCNEKCQSEDWKRHKKLCCKVVRTAKERLLELVELSDTEKRECLVHGSMMRAMLLP